MLNQIKKTLGSREFQTTALKLTGMVANVIVTSVVSNLVARGVENGVELLMDKIHGVTNPNIPTE